VVDGRLTDARDLVGEVLAHGVEPVADLVHQRLEVVERA
jgi:hypothetical protein